MTLTREKRDLLVSEFVGIDEQLAKLNSGARRLPRRKFDEFNTRRKAIKVEYFTGLPVIPLSCCPFCNTLYSRRFDPWSTDGIWWQAVEQTVETDEPEPCEHFELLRGAVRFNQKKIHIEKIGTSYLGPAVPYVVPKIMELPTMKAVISELPLECGYTTFPIAYFSTEKSLPGKLMQEWREEAYGWTNENGQPCWSTPQYPWDFELDRWISDKQLGWVDLSIEKPIVKFGTPKDCPFVDLEGTRQRQIFTRGKLSLADPPNNEEFSPFE